MEDIRRIKEQVFDQIATEEEQGARLKAQMRVSVNLNNSQETFWLYSKEYQKQRNERRDLHGNITGFDPNYTPPETVQIEGHRISKNSVLGGKLIQHRTNSFSYKAPKGTLTIDPQNNIIYKPYVGRSLIDAKTGSFEIKGEEPVQFQSLRKYIEQLEKKGERDRLREQYKEEKEEQQADLLLQKLQKIESTIEEEAEKQRRYIRDSLELKMQPILDPEQETVKRSAILDGALVIDGGPGTGKTTTLIQRINFLTASTIGESKKELSDAEITSLENNWRFFSPSRLLKLFLKNSMAQEGLNTDDRNIKVWKDYTDDVFKKYGLFNTQTQRPFLKAHKIKGHILPNDSNLLLSCRNLVEEAHFQDIRKRISRLIEMDTSGVSWSEEADKYKRKLKAALSRESIQALIVDFENWKSADSDSVQNLLSGLNNDIGRLSARIQIKVRENAPTVYSEIEEYLQEKFLNRSSTQPEEDEDELEEEESVEVFNSELELARFFRTITSAHAVQTLNKKVRKPKLLREWEEKVQFAFEGFEFSKVGELIYLRRFANQYISGAGRNIFNRIPTIYKQVRSKIAEALRESGYRNLQFEELIKNDRNRIHYDEMNLILWYINNLLKDIKTKALNKFKKIEHSYVVGFEEEEKAVLAVDEASDFSMIELTALASFSDPKYNSVTFSGDLMQRMTEQGVNDWTSLEAIFPNVSINRLTVSYRQSPTLLKLASKLYENVTGVKPDFKSYLPESSGEPKPVVKKLDNLQDTCEWLIDQIKLVYNRYEGNIPSVAIFARDDIQVREIAEQLEAADELLDVGITVRYSTSNQELVPDTQVCVYNIENIKGLEFEAVFFVNIDKIKAKDEELIQKYLYVGVSRAAYYLGVSYQEHLPKSLRFLDE